MRAQNLLNFITNVLEHLPTDWLLLTTHRLDIYNEELAKTEFLDQLDSLYETKVFSTSALAELPTAFDYIRLGHPLSSILEWTIAGLQGLQAEQVVAFASQIMPVLAILRKNLLQHKHTHIYYSEELPAEFDFEALKQVYGYQFEVKQVKRMEDVHSFDGSTVFISKTASFKTLDLHPSINFLVQLDEELGSVLVANGDSSKDYIPDIQHVRRRESIAMTPPNAFAALQKLVGQTPTSHSKKEEQANQSSVINSIHNITDTSSEVVLGSCGLSVQYAIMMGLIDHAQQNYPDQPIKIIVPPNCYGGTNDQARRVVAATKNVDILDLPVDKDHDMVQSTDQVLEQCAQEDAVPFIIAEIPTNPRVEVPDLDLLEATLSKSRQSPSGKAAIAPVFILDQTFCPNVQFLSEVGLFSAVQTISYVSGSKFPSGGKCTAGYAVANKKAEHLMPPILKHIQICDNEATALQIEILAEQLPSMNERIYDAYRNTQEFVDFIKQVLPEAKINFVSEEVVQQGFTPSVFSLDLPTKGTTTEEREAHKRALNQKLINMMITEIPNGSKHCVSYGQLKGCYWTIPATSTQGTTKEEDKDYIARVSVSPDLDLDLHKKVFKKFVNDIQAGVNQ